MPSIGSYLILMFHDITTMLPRKHPSMWYAGLRLNSNGSERSEELPAKSLFALFAPGKCVISSLYHILPLFYFLLAKLIELDHPWCEGRCEVATIWLFDNQQSHKGLRKKSRIDCFPKLKSDKASQKHNTKVKANRNPALKSGKA